MKKLLIVVACFLLIGYYEHHYIRKDCVATATTETGVIFEDKCGFTWYVEEQGYQVGDVADIKFYDNGTTGDIDDDVILKVEVVK